MPGTVDTSTHRRLARAAMEPIAASPESMTWSHLVTPGGHLLTTCGQYESRGITIFLAHLPSALKACSNVSGQAEEGHHGLCRHQVEEEHIVRCLLQQFPPLLVEDGQHEDEDGAAGKHEQGHVEG